ncbi:MAG: ABC transporter permease [Armatimonadetes bacterium]|nr:ABC transporter permease [Armatimonadota bacterium]
MSVLRYASVVGYAALGESVGQRSGVINIGLEGTMITSSYFAMIVALSSGSPWLGILAAIAVGVLCGFLQAFFILRLRADQVVVGTALNLLGLGLTGTLYRARFGTSGQLLSVPRLPTFGPGLDAVLLLWLVLVGIVTWALFKTNWGLALRAAGEYPEAVEASGFRPLMLRLQGLSVSSALSGLAGGYLALGIAGAFAENMTAGRGFVALAMVTFGRWHPIGVFAASVLIGYADSLQFELQARQVALPPQFFVSLPYLLALVVLIVAGRGTRVPAALGEPYPREPGA